jgi:hypothetical protein
MEAEKIGEKLTLYWFLIAGYMFRLLKMPLSAKKRQRVASNKNRERVKLRLPVYASFLPFVYH